MILEIAHDWLTRVDLAILALGRQRDRHETSERRLRALGVAIMCEGAQLHRTSVYRVLRGEQGLRPTSSEWLAEAAGLPAGALRRPGGKWRLTGREPTRLDGSSWHGP